MRGYLPDYELHAARDLSDALAHLADPAGGWRPFAGGTDLMVGLESGILPPGRYVSLRAIGELRGVDVTADTITLGALTTYTDVLRHERLQVEFPLLVQAAAATGGVATQNRGTIGGNIANASPAADTPPALLVYDAELELVSTRGTRRIPYMSFHQGYKQMDLAADELIRGVRLPRGRAGWTERYRKVGTRQAQAISKVCFAAAAHVHGGVVADIRLAYGSVAPTVVRCGRVERAVRGHRVSGDLVTHALAELASEIAPIDDVRSTKRYRMRVASNLLADFLRAL